MAILEQDLGPAVPLGGIGTGGFEIARDGRIRNVTINNNRSPELRIPHADATFLAVRTETGGQTSARILQTTSTAPFREAGIHAPYIATDHVRFDDVYPSATFGLRDPEFPASVSWRVMSPVLPYDTEAATLPMVVFSVQVRNNAAEASNISALFNWENLRGCVGTTRRSDRGGLQIIVLDELDELDVVLPGVVERGLGGIPLGLTFGLGEPVARDADGDYSIIAAARDNQTYSYFGWSLQLIDDIKRWWWEFFDEGRLPDIASSDRTNTCGALCLSETVKPGGTAQFSFIVTWMCPQYTLDGVNVGNGYITRYRDSVEIGGYGLRHYRYFLKAIDNWQSRFLASSLPKWFTRCLLNSSGALTANTAVTRDGGFVLADAVDDPTAATLIRNFYDSLGILLPFPAYAHTELGQYAGVAEGIEATALREGLVANIDIGKQALDNGAKLILAAARNFRMTGNVARLMDVYPRLKEAALHAAMQDKNGDGLPEPAGHNWVHGEARPGTPVNLAGLWIGAWTAMGYLARYVKYEKDVVQFTKMAEKAAESFERVYWAPRAGCYRFSSEQQPDTQAILCTADQLAGHWYRRFLRFDPPPVAAERAQRAAGVMHACLVSDDGVAASAPIGEDGKPCEPKAPITDPRALSAWFASALIEFGHVDAGLDVIRELCEHDGAGMAVWHALYALEGLLLSVPDKTLYIAPRLPKGITYLNAPIVTPVCLGWLTYQVERAEGYRQSIRVAFDSPIHISNFELTVPSELTAVAAYLTFDGETSCTTPELRRGAVENYVRIALRKPVLIQESATVVLTPVPPPEPAPPKR